MIKKMLKAGSDAIQWLKDLPVGNPSEEQILRRALETAGGIEVDLENPDEFLTSRGKDLTFYDVMKKDDRIEMVIDLKKESVLKVPAKVVSARIVTGKQIRLHLI